MRGLTVMLFLSAAPSPSTEPSFYLVTRECAFAAASLRLNGTVRSAVRPAVPPSVRRCSRTDQAVVCHSQMDVEGHLVDHPFHGRDTYTVVSDAAEVLQLKPADGTYEWMTVNFATRVAARVQGVNSPAEGNPESLDAVGITICRETLATADEAQKLSHSHE